jgi:5-methylcytosine-specific restriction endonuclease McrA
MRQIGTGNGKAISKPQGRRIRSSSNLTPEERHALVYSTPQWQALRKLVRQHWPRCVGCGAGAQLVDHITPANIAPDRVHDITNCQPLCRGCHDVKTRTIDAPGGHALAYDWARAKTHADMRPDAMKRWAAEMKASGAVALLLKGKRISEGDDVSC